MPTYPTWSKEEDEVIRQFYPSRGAKGTSNELRSRNYVRTDGAVKERAKNLGVRRNRKLMRPDGTWSDEEIAIVMEMFPKGGPQAVLETLRELGYSRTTGAIATRASMLGLRMRNTKRRMTKGGDKVIRNICLDTTLDRDVIERLDSVRNRSDYIRGLVEKDIKKSSLQK